MTTAPETTEPPTLTELSAELNALHSLTHELHTRIYALRASTRDDERRSYALRGTISTMASAVSALNETIYVAAGVADIEAAAVQYHHEPTD